MTQRVSNSNHNIELVDEMITAQQDVHRYLIELSENAPNLIGTAERSEQKIRILEELKKDLLSND